MQQYIAIDLKSFYASVECVERGLDPLTARLVVADIARTDKTICLAISPALKAYGLRGRERLYRVIQVAERAEVDFTVAPPQMCKYMEISRRIYGIYAKFVAPTDIHVYSIDEVFIDATPYLKNYHMSARELAEKNDPRCAQGHWYYCYSWYRYELVSSQDSYGYQGQAYAGRCAWRTYS